MSRWLVRKSFLYSCPSRLLSSSTSAANSRKPASFLSPLLQQRCFHIHRPTMAVASETGKLVEDLINNNKVMVFSKTTCPFCKKVKAHFERLNIEAKYTELNIEENGADIQQYLAEKTGQKTVPSVFINQLHQGGSSDIDKLVNEGKLMELMESGQVTSYDYDLFVIGGGSGGLACSKEAAALGQKAAVADFVKPTPLGTKWGIGGTCVNVGCIPKKLMHQAALLGEAVNDSRHFGWEIPEKVSFNWEKLVEGVQAHVKSLNWGYRVQLRTQQVKYYNSFAKLLDKNRLSLVGKNGKEEIVTARNIVIAVGGRPVYPDLPGAKECCITSDDIFSLPTDPGKTLFVGASYIALECAGFLHGIGNDVTVMVRSILLRGFDQDISEKIGKNMEEGGVKFHRQMVPTKFEKLEGGKVRVHFHPSSGGDVQTEDFDTVCLATGRYPLTQEIGLDNVGVATNPKTKFITVDESDMTNVDNIYAIGDVADGIPELTPVAIQAGQLLARRLFKGATLKCDYDHVPTTVFTPLEYGSCGFSEEKAFEKYGEENIEVYHSSFTPLEATVPHRPENECYAKLIVNTADENRVVGFHILGPNAGEVTQGFSIAFKLGARKEHFDNLIGIHPTNAEIFTTLDVTKSSGASALKSGC